MGDGYIYGNDDTGGASARITQIVEVCEGITYRLSFWVKGSCRVSGLINSITVTAVNPTYDQGLSVYVEGVGLYTALGTQAQVQLLVQCIGPMTQFVDDVTLTPVV